MTRKPVLCKKEKWSADKTHWKGVLEGVQLDTGISILFYTTDRVNHGPRWHVHPYDEIFIIRRGRAQFTVGKDRIEAHEGDVIMAPADVPHKFRNLGPGPLETTDIHLSDRWIQTDLEDPEQAG